MHWRWQRAVGRDGPAWLAWMELPLALAAPEGRGKRDSLPSDAGADRREEADCCDESFWEPERDSL